MNKSVKHAPQGLKVKDKKKTEKNDSNVMSLDMFLGELLTAVEEVNNEGDSKCTSNHFTVEISQNK